jgi:tRNA G26 N,N-dimethylase Trm1
MSCAASAAWSRPVSSYCCTEHGQRCGVTLLGRITTIAMSKSSQLGRFCTVAACPHVLQVMMAQVSDISETCGRALEIRKPSYIGRLAKPFFILEVYSPQRSVGHVAALEPS